MPMHTISAHEVSDTLLGLTLKVQSLPFSLGMPLDKGLMPDTINGLILILITI